MRRIDGRHGLALGAWAVVTALVLTGAGPLKTKRTEPPPKVEETVSNLAFIASGQDIKIEGVGLVSGLDNTGADPPPSYYRDRLVDDMRKAGVDHPNQILADKSFSLVIVRVKLPTGVTTSDRMDVEVELPPASGTKSLAGGYLIQTRLREVKPGGGSMHEGKDLAIAHGPVMIGSEARPNDPKVGRVLGGARPLTDIPFNLILKENRKSARISFLVESVVNQRFHETEGVKQEGCAHAKTDQFLLLKVPRVYHHNPGRFFEVVRRLPMVDNPALRAARQEIWGRQLLDVTTAGVASLSLEGLGPTAIESIKGGLASPHPQVRFFAAEALAYLNDSSGVEVLGDTAVKWPEFRKYALDALAALDQPPAHMKLRKLMDTPDVHVRYGAFNALRTLDETDPFLGRVTVIDEPPPDPDEEETDSMAVALRKARRRKQQEDPFALYLVDCEGPPMIHVARSKRCEVVIFGRGQKLLTPIVLGTGPVLLNAADGDENLEISKIVPSKFGNADEKVTSSLEIGDILRRVANLGINYPEIVSILNEASGHRNLPGPLVVDAVPAATAVYIPAAILGKDVTKKDKDVQKTNYESSPRRRGVFDFLRRR